MPHRNNELARILRHEIEAKGPLSFVRFMELALYHPVYGYYQQPLKQIGCQGDFYTSVAVGELFGQLLAFQFAQWLDSLGSAPPSRQAATSSLLNRGTGGDSLFQLVEGGAHNGRLAYDILSWFARQRPDLLKQSAYWIIEPLSSAREAQAQLLAPFRPRVQWFTSWEQVPSTGVRGAIFSNELLDALPVVRLGWDAARQAWFEWKVTWREERFAWSRAAPGHSPILQTALEQGLSEAVPPELLALLPDGFTLDLCPAATAWWSKAAESLHEGFLLTFDYGLEEHEIFAPHRLEGTLRSYRMHRLTRHALADPGQQDLTAHVNFSAVRHAGERLGLRTHCYSAQAAFLTRIAAEVSNDLPRFGSWTQAHTRQFQTLTHPNYFGDAFRVLLQTRLHQNARSD